jgi:hypothetical protein
MLIPSRDQGVLALLLVLGLYFPTSLGGEYKVFLYQAALLVALTVLLYLFLRHGMRPGAGKYMVFPFIVILTASTFFVLLTHPFPIGWGTLMEYILLVFVLSLDLREIRVGRFMRWAFVVANSLNIICGIAILTGNDWMGNFLSTFYSYFYPELVANMLSLHKPVLTFGTHSLAGFFLYLFFWFNWEIFQFRRSVVGLVFALSWLVLLAALTSVTAVGLAFLASAQVAVWLWKHNRRLFAITALGILTFAFFARQWIENDLGLAEPVEVAAAFLGNDVSGPLARYGPGGTERGRIEYLRDHPLSPIGFAAPVFAATVDSAPLEYMLRGSVPLLVLVYFGVYRFLRFNLKSRSHARILFLLIVAFETGFTVLTYIRTFYLLPLVVVYLNHIWYEEGREVAANGNLSSPQLQAGVS